MLELDIVVREVVNYDPFNRQFEVRLGPCPWVADELVWRVTRPVTRERAAELVLELLALIGRREAFAMPPEFSITGRLEPVNKSSGETK